MNTTTTHATPEADRQATPSPDTAATCAAVPEAVPADSAADAAAKRAVWLSLMEADYAAGVSLRALGKKYGITNGRVAQIAKQLGWVRNLEYRVAQRRDDLIRRQVAEDRAKAATEAAGKEQGRPSTTTLSPPLSIEAINAISTPAIKRFTEAQAVEAKAQDDAAAVRRHRTRLEEVDSALVEGLALVRKLLTNMGAVIDARELLEDAAKALASGDQEGLAKKVAGLVQLKEQIPMAKQLVEALVRLAGGGQVQVIETDRRTRGLDKPEDDNSERGEKLRRLMEEGRSRAMNAKRPDPLPIAGRRVQDALPAPDPQPVPPAVSEQPAEEDRAARAHTLRAALAVLERVVPPALNTYGRPLPGRLGDPERIEWLRGEIARLETEGINPVTAGLGSEAGLAMARKM